MGLNIIINENYDLTKGENKVLKRIKDIYKDYIYDAYLYVQQSIIRDKRPDFILIDSQRGVSILEVKDWDFNFIESFDKETAVLANGKTVDSPIKQIKDYYRLVNKCVRKNDELFDLIDDNNFISKKIILTNFTDIDLQESYVGDELQDSDIDVITKNNLDNKHIEIDTFFDNRLESVNLSLDLIRKIKMSLFTEVNVISSSGEIISALDAEQEEFARKIPNGHYMVTGVPGSGKTIILLARAITALKENPDWRIKILTYTNALVKYIDNRLQKLKEIEEATNEEFGIADGINFNNISVSTVHGEFAKILNKNDIKNVDIKEYSEAILSLDIDDNYKYDYVLIDEYQDLDVDTIKACIKLCKESHSETKNIFFAGDRLQSIYADKNINWKKDLGLDMRGRSKLLKKSYRTGKYIMDLAIKFLTTNEKLKEECMKFYDYNDDIECAGYDKNKAQFLNSIDDVYKEVLYLINNKGYYPSEIMIITQKKLDLESLYNNMPSEIKNNSIIVNRENKDLLDGKIKISTIVASKGLEAKNVFFCNIDDFKESKKSMKNIYVGLTRAIENIYIHYNEDYYQKEYDTYVDTLADIIESM